MKNLKEIISKIQTYQPRQQQETPLSAAVLILLIDDAFKANSDASGNDASENDVTILITKRSNNVALYRGHYCFPGGFKEPQDETLLSTMIREAEEEVHLNQKQYEVIGVLDDFADRYGNLVRPFVAVSHKDKIDKQLAVNEEIASYYFLKLTDLALIKEDKALEKIANRHPCYRYEQDEVMIWGLTASILVHLKTIVQDE